MKPEPFYELVAQMRKAQKRYFKDRTTSNLTDAKLLEKEVDQEIASFQEEGLVTGIVQLSFASIKENKHEQSE